MNDNNLCVAMDEYEDCYEKYLKVHRVHYGEIKSIKVLVKKAHVEREMYYVTKKLQMELEKSTYSHVDVDGKWLSKDDLFEKANYHLREFKGWKDYIIERLDLELKPVV